MEKRVTFELPKKVLVNEDGKRVINNWCLYAQRLLERKRLNEKKTVVVSHISETDRKVFQSAYKKLMSERAKKEGAAKHSLKRIKSSRSIRSEKSESWKPASDDDYVKCQTHSKELKNVPKPALAASKSTKPASAASKSKKTEIAEIKPSKSELAQESNKIVPKITKKVQIKPLPIKRKTWVPPAPPAKKLKPVVVIPPFKTRPWVPPAVQSKPIVKPVIEYPPLKMRKQKPPIEKPKTPLRVRLDKTFYPLRVSTLGKTWHLFKFITPKLQILRGNSSQYSRKFNYRSNGKQSAFIAAVALAHSQLLPMKFWEPATLDEIISYGDINFRKQMNKFRCHTAIKPTDIKIKIYTRRAKIFTETGARALRGIFDAQHKDDMVEQIKELFQDYECIIFTYCEQSYAVWKQQTAFYIFNSEDADETGRAVKKGSGTCCVLRSPGSIDQIVEYLAGLQKINKKCYELHSFKINKKISIEQEMRKLKRDSAVDHQMDEISVKPTASNLSGLLQSISGYDLYTSANNVRSIRAKEVETIECTRENVPMGICYAIATLCVSRSLDPEFYTRDIIDKIVVFGNNLMTECTDVCFTDFNLCFQSPCRDEINWNFELNDVFTNIQMDIFERKIISAENLAQAIEEFFNFYAVGVLVTPSFVVPIWKDGNEFFIFYSCPIDESGKISRVESDLKSPAFPGLVVFQSASELHQNIIGNIDEASRCKSFELRICNITMTDLCDDGTEKCGAPQMEMFADEELVLPAVAADVKSEIVNEKATIGSRMNSDEHQKIISAIKGKDNKAPGFIEFPNGGLICGRLSKDSKQLNEFTRAHHSAAICLTSVAMSCLQDLNCWSGETIDCVIKSGNVLYIESAVSYDSVNVPISMLIKTVIFCGSEINMKLVPFRDIPNESLTGEFLIRTICDMFSCYTNGYLCRGLECWALFKRGKAFYVFDPLGIEVDVKMMVQRRAVLYKFDSIDSMAKQLMEDAYQPDCDDVFKFGAILTCQSLSEPKAEIKNVEEKPKKKIRKIKKSKALKNQITMTMKNFEPICEENEDCEIDDFCAN